MRGFGLQNLPPSPLKGLLSQITWEGLRAFHLIEQASSFPFFKNVLRYKDLLWSRASEEVVGVRDEATLWFGGLCWHSRQPRKRKVREERDVKPRQLGLLWLHIETAKESYLWWEIMNILLSAGWQGSGRVIQDAFEMKSWNLVGKADMR